MKEFGYFDDKNNEFVIITPRTPRPWENRLWNDKVNIQLFNHGTGMTYARDNKGRFILFNYANPNRFFYIYDKDEKTLWSPAWYPTHTELDFYEARVGMKYSVITGRKNNVEVKWKITVHYEDAAEIWEVDIKNLDKKQKNLLIVPFYQVDLTLNDPYYGAVNLFKSYYEKEDNLLYIKNNAYVRKAEDDALGFHSSLPIEKYEMSIVDFLKDYTSLSHPATVLNDEFVNSNAERASGVLNVNSNEKVSPVFAPGYNITIDGEQQLTIDFEIFIAGDIEEAKVKAKKYRDEGAFKKSLDFHKKENSDFLKRNFIKTGDKEFDRYVNVWAKHQAKYNAWWNRGWSMGFRDSMSDVDMFRMFNKDLTRMRILRAGEHIFDTGLTVRAYDGVNPKSYFDGGAWYLNAVCQYIRESGEFDFLKEELPYLESQERDTVLGHMKRIITFYQKNCGSDGIVRMGFGDWNDALGGIDRAGKGQSVWLTLALIWGLNSFIKLLEILDDKDVEEYKKFGETLKTNINDKFYEDDRYVRAKTDAGKLVGSKTCSEGKMYITVQGLAMFSDVADQEKADTIIKTARDNLYVNYGVLLLAPPYESYHEDIGRLTGDRPGEIENASNYVQGCMFYTYGLAYAGYGQEAYDILLKVLPNNPKNPISRSCVEPYSISNSYQGPAAQEEGKAMYAWRTGTTGWFLKTVWEGIIGILPDYKNLKINASLADQMSDIVEVRRVVRSFEINFDIVKSGIAVNEDVYDLVVDNGCEIEYDKLKDNMKILVKC